MLLAIDVGNTNTSVGVFAEGELRSELRLSTRRSWTRDEVAASLRHVLALADVDLRDVSDAVIACVVPPALPHLKDALETYANIDALVVGPGVKTGMPIRYDPPQDVGADRIVTAVAAYARHAGPEQGVIIVDFGTATTFDVVEPGPRYLGGAIAPGIGISADALFARAAKLPRVEIQRPPSVIGRNTVCALQSGLVFGYSGLVEGVIGRIRAEVDWPTTVVATGGYAAAMARDSELIDVVDDALVLEGLRMIHALNRGTH